MNRLGTQITWLREASSGAASASMLQHKKQGRRRSMPSTTLPAPEIEIGSRLPVAFTLPRICSVKCDPVHKLNTKIYDSDTTAAGGSVSILRKALN
jgi:hypothetical protein